MAKKTNSYKNVHETDLDTLVKIEFLTINEKPYLGQVSDDELLYVWVKVFNRTTEELFGVTSTKTLTRNVRATFKLKRPIKLSEISDTAVFMYEKYLDDGSSEEITGRILGHGVEKPAELGDAAKVTVKTNFGVEASGVVNWLKIYGIVSPAYDFTINKNTGLKTDVLQAEVVLHRHIPEYLPMYGQKVQVHYSGIPRMCNRCYGSGHMRKECNNKKKDWIAYVASLIADGIEEEYVGTWKKALERWRNANADKE